MKVTVKSKQINDKKVKEIMNTYKVNKKLAEFLAGRNIKKEVVDALLGDFVLPSNINVTNIEAATDTMIYYLSRENTAIYVYGDYDSDGVNSCYIIHDTLNFIKDGLNNYYETEGLSERCECEIVVHFPNRSQGYGLSLEWCKELVEKNKTERKEILVMTVDNGITKKVETEYLLDNDVNVIITDHHYPKANEVPEDVIVIDPWLHNDKDSLGLCGAGVTYKLCANLLERYNDTTRHYMYLPHVAIATITDVMPLTVENAHYLKYGFYIIENEEHCSDSIRYYKEFKGKEYLSTKDIAWSIGPELNACGRMLNIDAAKEFILSNEDNVADAYAIVNNINKARKDFQAEVLDKILDTVEVDDKTKFVVAHVDNLGGVGGPIASRLSERFNLPCMVLGGEGELLHGSARSLGDLDLQELFSKQVKLDNLLNFGGHKGAAGVSVDKKKIKSLQDSLNDILKDVVFVEEGKNNEITIDGYVTLNDINKANAEFTRNIPLIGELTNPKYMLKDLEVLSVKPSGKNPKNIKFTVTDKVKTKDIWAWNFADRYEALGNPKTISMIGNIEPNFMMPGAYTFSVDEII